MKIVRLGRFDECTKTNLAHQPLCFIANMLNYSGEHSEKSSATSFGHLYNVMQLCNEFHFYKVIMSQF